MTGISHNQAIKLIQRRLDGSLNESQTLSLGEHLRSCDSCRAYSDQMELLPNRLQNEFHLRWDRDPGPSHKVLEQVMKKARNIPMQNRISSGVKVIAGVATLVMLAFLVSFVVSRLQSETIPAADSTANPTPQQFPSINTNKTNGDWIAFTMSDDASTGDSFQDISMNVYMIRSDGTGLRNLTYTPKHAPIHYYNLQWSPNGKNLVVLGQNMDYDFTHIVRASEYSLESISPQIVDPNHYGYSWSPNSDKIVFANSFDGNYDIYTVYADGRNDSQLRQLTNDPGHDVGAVWSPDGSQIAFQRLIGENLSVYIMNADGSNQREVAYGLGKVKLRWSLDGTSIYASTTDESWLECEACIAKPAIYRIELDELSVHQIYYEQEDSKVAGWYLYDTPQNRLYFMRIDHPALLDFWGTWLYADSNSVNEIGEIDPHQTCKTTTGNSLNEYISPNENYSVISNFCAGSFDLYLANRETTNPEQKLTHLLSLPLSTYGQGGNGAYLPISWSPDGRWLTYDNGNQSIYLLNVEEAIQDPTTEPSVLFKSESNTFTLFELAWQPALDNDIFEEMPTPKPEGQADNSSNLIIDPQSCKPFSDTSFDVRPPNQLYGYELIQGISFVDEDFSYEFWLYCDPSLKPDDNEHFSSVSGLGVFASWRYNGPLVEGMSQDYFGFEPVIKLKSFTKWIGPLYKASADGKFGMPAEETVQDHIQQGTPIQFSIMVDSSLGQNGATFSFDLEPTASGLEIRDLRAEHSTTPYDGLIAFTSDTDNGNLDIYTMRPDGSELTDLTDHPANDFNPFWSPDGRRIAFESDRTGSTQIFLMDADGSNLIQLTDGEAAHEFRSANPWSPDGSKLLFTESHPGNENWLLFAMDANGQIKKQLVQSPDQYGITTWSPDSKHIVLDRVESQGNRGRIHLYVVDPDGNNLTDITKLLPPDEDLSGKVQWAADGGSLFFIAGRYAWENNNSRSVVYEASLDGNTLIETFVTSDQIDDWWNGTALVHGFLGSLSWTWVRSDRTTSTLKPLEDCETREAMMSTYKRSANGSVLYGVQCDTGDLRLYWANPDGTQIRQLLDSPISANDYGLVDVFWSPDDSFIAFTVVFHDKTEMYMLNVNEALNNSSIQPDKYIVGGPGFISYNISWQPQP